MLSPRTGGPERSNGSASLSALSRLDSLLVRSAQQQFIAPVTDSSVRAGLLSRSISAETGLRYADYRTVGAQVCAWRLNLGVRHRPPFSGPAERRSSAAGSHR